MSKLKSKFTKQLVALSLVFAMSTAPSASAVFGLLVSSFGGPIGIPIVVGGLLITGAAIPAGMVIGPGIIAAGIGVHELNEEAGNKVALAGLFVSGGGYCAGLLGGLILEENSVPLFDFNALTAEEMKELEIEVNEGETYNAELLTLRAAIQSLALSNLPDADAEPRAASVPEVVEMLSKTDIVSDATVNVVGKILNNLLEQAYIF